MTAISSTQSRTFESAETLAHGVAEWLCGLAQASGREFAVCLSGGSTPRRLYERLAMPAIASNGQIRAIESSHAQPVKKKRANRSLG